MGFLSFPSFLAFLPSVPSFPYVSWQTWDINGRVVTLAHRVFTYLISLSTDPFFLWNRSCNQNFHSSLQAFLFTYMLNNSCYFSPFLFFSNMILVTWYLIGLICISEDIDEGEYWLIYLKLYLLQGIVISASKINIYET